MLTLMGLIEHDIHHPRSYDIFVIRPLLPHGFKRQPDANTIYTSNKMPFVIEILYENFCNILAILTVYKI